jgi:RNA polymerase sigma factor (sigma-70 family)
MDHLAAHDKSQPNGQHGGSLGPGGEARGATASDELIVDDPSPPDRHDDASLQLVEQTRAFLADRRRKVDPSPTSREAWERFFATYSPIIRSTAKHLGWAEAELDDCVQEVWEELLTKLQGFRYDPDRGPFRAWLYTLTVHWLADRARRNGRLRTEVLDAGALAVLVDPGEGPEAACEQQQTRDLVRVALVALRRRVSEITFLAFQFRYLEGRSVKEIAARLELDPDQVRARLHRIKPKLRKLLPRSDASAGTGPDGQAAPKKSDSREDSAQHSRRSSGS